MYIFKLPLSLNRINAIIYHSNQCNQINAMFYVLSFIQFCARKLLLSLAVYKLIFDYKVFFTKFSGKTVLKFLYEILNKPLIFL